jgi:hypothetical protein
LGEERRSLLEALGSGENGTDALILWHARHRILSVERSGSACRVELPLDIALHFEARTLVSEGAPSPPGVIVVTRCLDRVELWSQREHARRVHQAAVDGV